MENVFIKLLNMSISAGWLILVVILLRLILKNAPKWIRYILWGIVAARLVCPLSIESVFSLIPSAETVPQEIMYAQKPTIHSGVLALNSVVNPYLSESLAPEMGASVNPMQIVISLAAVSWIVGVLGMLVYAGISYGRLRKKVAASIRERKNIYFCDDIDTPFVLGIIKPRIYLPSVLAGDDKAEYVIAHEEAHIKRRDHWWKPFGFLLLAVYWFNPMIWVAYVLLCRDIELACDEYVISSLGEKDKKAYSVALLVCSIPLKTAGVQRRMISACPLAFGEVGVKNRIKAVLNYKKPAFWMIVVAVISCMVVAVCFLTDPKDKVLYALDCNTVSEGRTGYIQPAYYPEGFDWDYEELSAGYINEKGVLIFTADWDTDELVVSEDYYHRYNPENSGGSTFIERETYTLEKNKAGQFELNVELRSENGDMAVYFIRGPVGVYVMKIIFWEDVVSIMTADEEKTSEAEVDFVEMDTSIEELLEQICEGSTSSRVQDYIDAHSGEYQELIQYGKYTLWYCFGEFMEGGQTDLRGQIMASVCQDIMLGFGEAMLTDTEAAHGQEWFDIFYVIARSLEKRYTEEELKNDYPVSWLLVKMADWKGYGEKELVPTEELDWERILKDHLRNDRVLSSAAFIGLR